jgi:hypothetical protein
MQKSILNNFLIYMLREKKNSDSKKILEGIMSFTTKKSMIICPKQLYYIWLQIS